MTFTELLENYSEGFKTNGQFNLLKEQFINDAVRQNNIPAKPGVYIIYNDLNCSGNVIYIGKSGKINQCGTWGKQTLRKRLTKKQEKQARKTFFQNLITENNLKGLSFKWFITFSEITKILPGFAEAELIQAYFNQHQCLPALNKCF